MDNMTVSSFIKTNLEELAKMPIAKLKMLLRKVVARHDPADKHTIETIKALIRQKKGDYLRVAEGLARVKWRKLQAARQHPERTARAGR